MKNKTAELMLDSQTMAILTALQAGGAHAGLSYASIVSRVISELRKALNLSQEELAKRIGLTQSALSRVEHGDTVFNADHAIAIAPALGVLPHEIFAIADQAVDWLRRQDVQVAATRQDAKMTILGPGAASLLVGNMVAGAVGQLLSTSVSRKR